MTPSLGFGKFFLINDKRWMLACCNEDAKNLGLKSSPSMVNNTVKKLCPETAAQNHLLRGNIVKVSEAFLGHMIFIVKGIHIEEHDNKGQPIFRRQTTRRVE